MSHRKIKEPKIKQSLRHDAAAWLQQQAYDQGRSHDFEQHIMLLGAESVRWRADRHLPDMSSVPLGTPRANGDTVDLPAGAQPYGPKAWPILQIDTSQLFGMDESLPRSPAGILVLYAIGPTVKSWKRDYVLKFYPHVLDSLRQPTALTRHMTPIHAEKEGSEQNTWVGEPISLRPQGSLSYPGPLGLEHITDSRYGPSAAFFAGMQTEYESWRFQWCFGDNPFKGIHNCISSGIQMFGHPVIRSLPALVGGQTGDADWIVLLQVGSPYWAVAPKTKVDLVKIDDGCCHIVYLVPKDDWEKGNIDRLVMRRIPDSF